MFLAKQFIRSLTKCVLLSPLGGSRESRTSRSVVSALRISGRMSLRRSGSVVPVSLRTARPWSPTPSTQPLGIPCTTHMFMPRRYRRWFSTSRSGARDCFRCCIRTRPQTLSGFPDRLDPGKARWLRVSLKKRARRQSGIGSTFSIRTPQHVSAISMKRFVRLRLNSAAFYRF